MNSLSVWVVFFIGMNQGWSSMDNLPQYLPDHLAVRLKPEAVRVISPSQEKILKTGIASLDILCNRYGITEFRPLFINSLAKRNGDRLRRWFRVKFSKGDIEEVIRAFERDPNIEEVDKIWFRYTRLVPNDPYYSSQWYLSQVSDHDIDAPEAWDITTGDTAVVIGIIDTGILFGHEDLFDNLWHNPGEDAWTDPYNPETGNGIDDDGNGLVDDWIGYDWVDYEGSDAYPGEDATTPDNNPSDFNGHGTRCAGVCCAVTDNLTGIAGIGWRCRIMCLRAGLSLSGMGEEYGAMLDDAIAQAITYGTDMGASILLLPWGGRDSSDLVNDAVDYAIGNGVLLVKAAANENSDTPDFLDNREDVLSVAATDPEDHKAYYSNYGDWVDVSAPGVEVLTTSSYHYTPGYDTANDTLMGTSIAASVVAGVGALVKAVNPLWDGSQIFERIVNTADNIDGINPGYEGMLGSGRVNAYWAVYTPSSDVGVVDISTIPLNPVRDQSTTVQALVRNFGSNPQSNFPAYAEIAPVEVLLSEDFNHGGSDPPGWTIIDGGSNSGPPGRWHAVFEGDSDYYIESNSDDEGTGSTQDEELISPSVNCLGKTGVFLRFWTQYSHWFVDQGDVDVSVDGGITWTTVMTFNADITPGKVYTVDISSIADNQPDVRFRFHFVSSNQGWWRIDDVEMLCYSSSVYADTVNVLSISPDEEITITFPKSWIPTQEGEYLARVWTQLPGDERPENDERKEKILVLPPFQQPDNQIKNGDETIYLGDNIYNETGTGQTRYQDVVNNDTAIYHIKIENDGNVADSFKVTGTGGWGQWEVRYFDALSGGNDITSQITGSGWFTGLLQPGESREIRVGVVADWFWIESGIHLFIRSTSLTDNTKRDVVRASTSPIFINRPDNLIKNQGETEYIGDDIYNSDGTDQTKSQEIPPGQTAIYHIQIQNDGNYPSMFQIIGTPSDGGWEVKYYDALTGGEDITDLITGPYGWVVVLGSPDTTVEMRVEITPDDTVSEGVSKTVFIATFSSADTSKKDIVGAVTSVFSLYQPDNLIKNKGDLDYVGDNVYNLDGTEQTKSQTIVNNDTAVYYIKIENDGKERDSLLVKGTSEAEGWRVSYFDTLIDGKDITSEITGSGWSTGYLDPGESREIRVEVVPDETILGGDSLEVLITSSSQGNAHKRDAVKAITNVAVLYQPDNQVRNSDETDYTGDDIYNTTGDGQTKDQTVEPNQTAIYYIKIENDGNTSGNFVVTGDTGTEGWDVKYFDSLSGGNDITNEVVGPGWLLEGIEPKGYKEIRVEVTPGIDIPPNVPLILLIKSTAQDEPEEEDAVKVITTSTGVGIEERFSKIPFSPILYSNLPNPFKDYTLIKYGISRKGKVNLTVYDITGKLVRTLVSEEKEPGYYDILWDGKDDSGKVLPNGIYFYKLTIGSYNSIKKLVILR